MELTVTGEENIPKDRNFVLIGNHQSMVDILVILHTIKRPIGFVAKAELKKFLYSGTGWRLWAVSL